MTYVEHDQVHLYVRKFTSAVEEALGTHLHAEPVPRGGNLHVMEPYYGNAVWYAAKDVDGIM